MALSAGALRGLPEVAAGDDLAALIAAAAPEPPRDGDVLVVAHKVVSKAEGRVRALASVEPGARARELAAEHGKDPRHVQVVLDESAEAAARRARRADLRHPPRLRVRERGRRRLQRRRARDLVLLPADPDASARALRARLRELTGAAPAVVVTDSFGRAWRHGQAEVAIGCAGPRAARRLARPRRRRRAASCARPGSRSPTRSPPPADLVRAKDSREPVVLVRGLERFVTAGRRPRRRGAGAPGASEDLPLAPQNSGRDLPAPGPAAARPGHGWWREATEAPAGER